MSGPSTLSKLRAAKAYYDFTGHRPTGSYRKKLDDEAVAGYRMGDVVGIAYEAKRDGETAQYFHRFKKKVRPDLVSRSDGKQLYITGGKYRITDRGIEDMPDLFVVNPSRRKRKVSMAKPRRRRRSVSHRRRKSSAVYRRNPVRRARRRRARRAGPYTALVARRNPIRRRRRRSVARRRHSYRRNPVRGFRRNPFSLGGIQAMVLPAAFVGAGAVATEVAMGYLPIPVSWKTGPVKYVTKAGVAVIGGMLLGKMVSRKLGEAFAMGGVAIAVHDALRTWLAGTMPQVAFGGSNWRGYGYPPPMGTHTAYPTLGYYSAGVVGRPGMGAYQPFAGSRVISSEQRQRSGGMFRP